MKSTQEIIDIIVAEYEREQASELTAYTILLKQNMGSGQAWSVAETISEFLDKQTTFSLDSSMPFVTIQNGTISASRPIMVHSNDKNIVAGTNVTLKPIND